MAGRFEWLDKTNAVLGSLTDWLDVVFADIHRYSQEGVDEICRYAGDVVSYHLNRKKADVLNALHEQYLGQMAIIAMLKPIVELNPTDLGSVISAITTLVAPFVAPYQQAVSFVTELVPKVVELSNNMMKIATYQPTIDTGEINFDKFQIKFTPFTIQDVIAGSVPYPDPPEPFQPPKPITSKQNVRFYVRDAVTREPVQISELLINDKATQFTQKEEQVTASISVIGKFNFEIKANGYHNYVDVFQFGALHGKTIFIAPKS